MYNIVNIYSVNLYVFLLFFTQFVVQLVFNLFNICLTSTIYIAFFWHILYIKIKKTGYESGNKMKDTVVESIYNKMVEYITTGKWVAGSKIPSENELATTFQASRSSVRQAISQLKALVGME